MSRLVQRAPLAFLACGSLLLGCARPATALQEEATPLEEIARLQARIQELNARYEEAAGEDRELYFDQLRRRWLEHHDLLGQIAEEVAADRDAGEEDPRATAQLQAALAMEIRAIQSRIPVLRSRIADIRLARPSTSPEDLPEAELELTELNTRVDRLYAALADDLEYAEAIGMDVAAELATLDDALADRAALMAARVELALDQQAALMDRRVKPGADTVAIASELAALQEKLLGTTTSLRSMADLMDRRGLHTVDHRRLLLTATGELGLSVLDPEVVGGLFSSWGSRIWEWIQANIGTILVRLTTILLILLVAGFLARLGRRGVNRVLSSSRIRTSELLKGLAIGSTSKLIWLLGLLVVLSVMGINVGPMLAGLGIVGFILGFALQDTLSNFAAGLMIMVYRPFDVGDLVTAAGVTGTVKDLTLVSTVITTFDNKRMVVPNGKVWGDVINNATAEDIRRVDLVFGIGYDDDIDKARGILEEVAREHELVLDEPAPVVRVHSLGESSVDFVCRPWCRTQDYWSVYWDVTETVKQRFDELGVSIPFPQRDVHLYQHVASAPEATSD